MKHDFRVSAPTSIYSILFLRTTQIKLIFGDDVIVPEREIISLDGQVSFLHPPKNWDVLSISGWPALSGIYLLLNTMQPVLR